MSKDFPNPPLNSYLECAALGHRIWSLRGRAGQVNANWVAEAEGADVHGERWSTSGWLQCSHDSELAPAGRALLAGAVATALTWMARGMRYRERNHLWKPTPKPEGLGLSKRIFR